jgi:chemotaxis protein methyltransferase CheR
MNAVENLNYPLLTDREFSLFQELIFQYAGITFLDSKKPLVFSRLSKRVGQLGLASFLLYYEAIKKDKTGAELQVAINLLTTNETYFYREEKHFNFLREIVENRAPNLPPFRVWSAACSTGEEPYTIAMMLSELLHPDRWHIDASDINTQVLESAQKAIYSMERINKLPEHLLKKYCLQGTGPQAGKVQIVKELRSKINFYQVNLDEPLPNNEKYDIIFLRNVIIYFDGPVKTRVVESVARQLKPDGYLFMGHAESLHGIVSSLSAVKPAIYRWASTARSP